MYLPRRALLCCFISFWPTKYNPSHIFHLAGYSMLSHDKGINQYHTIMLVRLRLQTSNSQTTLWPSCIVALHPYAALRATSEQILVITAPFQVQLRHYFRTWFETIMVSACINEPNIAIWWGDVVSVLFLRITTHYSKDIMLPLMMFKQIKTRYII